MDLGQIFKDILLNCFNYGLPPNICTSVRGSDPTTIPASKKPKTVKEDQKLSAGWINNPEVLKE